MLMTGLISVLQVVLFVLSPKYKFLSRVGIAIAIVSLVTIWKWWKNRSIQAAIPLILLLPQALLFNIEIDILPVTDRLIENATFLLFAMTAATMFMFTVRLIKPASALFLISSFGVVLFG